MTRNLSLRYQKSQDGFVRSEVVPATVDGASLQAGVDPGFLRAQASRDSLKRSRVMHATDEQQHGQWPARAQSPAAKYQQRTGFVRSPVTSATAAALDLRTAPISHQQQSRRQHQHQHRNRSLQRSPIVSITTDPDELAKFENSMTRSKPVAASYTPAGAAASFVISSSSSSSIPAASSDAFDPAAYTAPYLKFMTENPTVFHAVDSFASRLEAHGYRYLSERDEWSLKAGGKYYITRNGSGLIAFNVGHSWQPGDRAAVVACHVDAITAKVKPISDKPTSEGYLQLGVAHYGGALSQTWIDRDLSIGGRVFVRESGSGKIAVKLVKLPHPVAKIPSIAPHFGLPAQGQENRETRMVPIVGLDNSDISAGRSSGFSTRGSENPAKDSDPEYGFGFSAFAKTQPPRLVKAIARELAVSPADIVNWELEMYSSEEAKLLGLDQEFISAGRIDDKICSWAAVEALIASNGSDGVLNVVGLFDDEEVGSLLRQGAQSNFLPGAVERICEAFGGAPSTAKRTFAKSFLISADVSHAYNPNYADVYMHGHTPRLNVGVAISFDSNAHMSTDGVSSTILAAVAEKSGSTLQPFQIRNDSRSGGTVGPMLSSATGMRSVDAGIPQLSMHSIRATTGSLDPGLGVKLFKGFFDHYEAVDQEVAQE